MGKHLELRDETLSEEHVFANDKLRGGYYTPPSVARWLCDWAVTSSSDQILEPSCGDGSFLVCAAKRLLKLGARKSQASARLQAIEISSEEAVRARERLQNVIGSKGAQAVINCDFFTWLDSPRARNVDCVVGNPPFIRYQNFPEPCRSRAMRFMQSQGLEPNKLTNIWVPFVVGAVTSLNPDGRLAMVLPAELLQVTYARQLRSYLADIFTKIELFACNETFFERAEQEVVLLLAEGKRSERRNTRAACRIDLKETSTVAAMLETTPGHNVSSRAKVVDHDNEKWLKYFLAKREISLMRALRKAAEITSLGQHASVDVGVVTGKNEFFVVDRDKIKAFRLSRYVTPLLGRSHQLKGAIVTAPEWQSFADDGLHVHLLDVSGRINGRMPKGLLRYIQFGEEAGFHSGYKCSIRNPWYVVPSVWSPDCFVFRQIYDFPRIVLNGAQATSTDTIHRLRTHSMAPKALAALCYNYLFAASAEVEGRSYGGGVLELEPTEAERLLVPAHCSSSMPLKDLDRLVRTGRLEDALFSNSRQTLMDGIGMAERDCIALRDIWHKLRDRRLSRRRRKPT